MEKVVLNIENGQPVAKKIQPVEIKGQRVLTTEQLGEVYEVEEVRIRQGFSRNQDKFQEGKHYFKLQGEELKQFKREYLKDTSLKLNSLMLWTERGANRHCKILDTDKAWEQFDNLEETYFRVKENELPPMTIEDILIQNLQQMKDVKQQLNQVNYTALEAKHASEENKEKLEEFPLFTIDSKELSRVVSRVAIKCLGGKGTPAYKELNRKVFSDIYKQVWREFDVTSCAAIKRKYLDDAKKFISEYKLPRALANEIEILNNQVSF
ncbi:ORF6N domain-containing protein [Clostridium sporogenes]|uniref:ORF6N domain-containing protein n=1 Tax=Clostridium sporogenes TaxID=1509 RepID=UPI001F37D79C|nr:ORF6N domain-containing protein [Clostridium sporogenes]UJA30898.1 ORF6C domain-containing protein [Clostridium sporogenes]